MNSILHDMTPSINSTYVLIRRYLRTSIRLQHLLHPAIRARMHIISLLAPRIALQHALDRFVTPPRFAHSAHEKKLIALARPHNIDTAHGTIAAWAIGIATNPAVILCHGWGGRGAQLRGFVAPLVDAGYQVVLFDHIGHGFSDGKKAALVDFWRGLEAVWDALIDRGVPVHGMVSHSLGGAAVASALRRSLTRRHIEAPPPRVVLIAPPASLIRYSRLFARYFGIPERVRRAMQWRFERQYGVAWDEFELPHSVSMIDAPALFIHDHDDQDTRLAGSIALASAWPDARFHATRGLGHRRVLRDQSVIQATVDFIADKVVFQRPVMPADDRPSPLF